MHASVQLVTSGRGTRDIDVPCPWRVGSDDLLWSPNSKAFFINADCGEAISGFVVSVHLVDSENVEVGLDLTQEAWHDMVKSFPPCKAVNHDPNECKLMQTDHEYYNMSGIDWLEDSSGIVVISEVPSTQGKRIWNFLDIRVAEKARASLNSASYGVNLLAHCPQKRGFPRREAGRCRLNQLSGLKPVCEESKCVRPGPPLHVMAGSWVR